MNKTMLLRCLNVILTVVNSLEQSELDLLVSGKGRLKFVADDDVLKQKVNQIADIEHIREQLAACKDREDAKSLLANVGKKEFLVELAKTMQINITKNDRREDVENKIIEFVIGGKLRSEAIQTLSM